MNIKPLHFHSHGKLLLTGEYFVLDGARALALPTKLGQSLQVTENESDEISWTSYDADGSVWFTAPSISLLSPALKLQRPQEGGEHAQDEILQRLLQILQAMERQKPGFFQQFQGLQIETRLDFLRQWGLGTSSTLVANLAQWAGIDPFLLLQQTFGGSGYDIACAMAAGPITYQLIDSQPIIKPIEYHKSFTKRLYFVYLGKKQDSRQGISHYRQAVKDQPNLIKKISNITSLIIDCQEFTVFEKLILQHEQIISAALQLPRAKDLYFKDYWGEIKSLGAWGGDFILATSDKNDTETKLYFNEKGFSVVLPYEEIIL